MSDAPQRRHALTAFLDTEPAFASNDSGARLEARGYLNLRGDPGAGQFLQAAQAALGQPLPTVANTFTRAEHTIFWLGPDEWLLATAIGSEGTTAERLKDSLAGQVYSLVDVTGGQVLIRLRGDRVRETLARGCTLDLHPRAFKAGQCAQTSLARTSMLIALIDDAPTFDVIVRRSFADYAARWLSAGLKRARPAPGDRLDRSHPWLPPR